MRLFYLQDTDNQKYLIIEQNRFVFRDVLNSNGVFTATTAEQIKRILNHRNLTIQEAL